MTEKELEHEARLAAIEHVLGHTLARLHLLLGTPEEQLDAIEKQMEGASIAASFPTADPALAVKFAKQVQEDVQRLSAAARDIVAMRRSKLLS
ncbi:hypothetical protein [Ensifer aridi]|uniref:hypothetical protein n=1 Tax=Ensifer aridi TaxID=1708715 RepID=UPI0009C07148|nr:hypothetical protein [Ensifer aridi]